MTNRLEQIVQVNRNQELNGYEVPYQGFSDFVVRYGPVTALRLGSVNAVVVNGIDSIKEVLINEGQHEGSRPHFRRYQLLFSGNKGNSLAFCDWSDVAICLSRNYSFRFDEINTVVDTPTRYSCFSSAS
uniref:Uncharacterized protein n=1 Tax=Anopheles maculatus TaxID=74869 RepID=A0A182T8J9_9DIPT